VIEKKEVIWLGFQPAIDTLVTIWSHIVWPPVEVGILYRLILWYLFPTAALLKLLDYLIGVVATADRVQKLVIIIHLLSNGKWL
jgi:hypothetical protein